MTYNTFEIALSAMGEKYNYLINAKSNTQGEATAWTKINPGRKVFKTALAQLYDHTISSRDLLDFGMLLYQTLFIDEVNVLFNRALGETVTNQELGLRIRLSINSPELSIVPWEFLYAPERHLFLSASIETPLSRYLNLIEPVPKVTCQEKIRLLAVIPQNSGLNTQPERQILQEMANKVVDKIIVDFLDGPVTRECLSAALRQQKYHILHYAGHGAFKNDEAFLFLDRDQTRLEPVSAEQFANFFLDYPSMRLVFLNACHGAARSAHQALVGFAPRLILRGIPAVIALQYSISDQEAIIFATELYQELSDPQSGGQIEVAVSRARQALLQKQPDSPCFGNIVLYLRAVDGRLWEQNIALSKKIFSFNQMKQKLKLVAFWSFWILLVATLLGIFPGILNLPHQTVNQEIRILNEAHTTYLRGVVTNQDAELIPGATVMIKELPIDTVLITTTTDDGGFFFATIPAKVGDRVRIYVTKAGYKSQNEYVTLPGPLKIVLER